MPDLVVDNVFKRYGMGPHIIEGLSTVFTPGTGTGLVGRNGSGKTTFLRMLSVLSFPTSGRIEYDGFNIHEEPYRYLGRVGLVPDAPDLPHYMTAVELLEYVLRARGRWDADALSRITDLFDGLLLDERRNNLVGTYSSGMLAKTQIALGLITEPEVLLMDEPFRALDDASTAATIEQLHAFKARGGILILSSHIRSTLEAVCDGYLSFGRQAEGVASLGA